MYRVNIYRICKDEPKGKTGDYNNYRTPTPIPIPTNISNPTSTLPVNSCEEEFSPVLDCPSAMTGVVEKVGQAGENVSGGARNGVEIC